MTIPDYQSLMLPLLQYASDGEEHRLRDAIEQLSQVFGLSADERAELLPSGSQLVFDNRVGWAKTYMKQAGILESSRRGVFRITDRGRGLLKQQPAQINLAVLDQYPEFREFRTRRRVGDPSEQVLSEAGVAREGRDSVEIDSATPEDNLAAAYERLRKELEEELLEQVKSVTPPFFERLVIDLLVAMGYGGSRRDAARAVGKSGDGGIDGIIKEDKLGLDVIYVQAKRWQDTVGRPEVQKFAGALQGHRATKGVFITTSAYSREAIDYAKLINTKIVLLDGRELANLMIDHNVGIASVGTYEIKKIDAEYFEGE